MHSPIVRAVILSSVLGSVACASSTGPEGGGTANGPIVFMRLDSIGWYVSSMNGDGSDRRTLTGPLLGAPVPARTADGSRIAFVSSAAPAGVWVMNIDGSAAHPILPASAPIGSISWSPDGTRLALGVGSFQGNVFNGVWVIDSDGTNLTSLDTHQGDIGAPAWAPDGQHIAYVVGDYPFTEGIYVMSPSGANPTLIYNVTNEFVGYPAWSPSGTRIAFSYGPESITADGIGVVNADGTGARFLTLRDSARPAPFDFLPSWSRDGQWIVFQRGQPFGVNQQEASDIYVMQADGSRLAAITRAGGPSLAPSW